jgi:hypothetical protein
MATFELSDKVKGLKLNKAIGPRYEYHTPHGHVAINLATCTQAEADAAVAAGFKYLVKTKEKAEPAEPK